MKDYIEKACRTESQTPGAMRRYNDPDMFRLTHAAFGLATEVGEFIDQIKKHVYYGKELDTVNLQEEIGDILWYIAIALDQCGVADIGKVMKQNIAKLAKRYPDKFKDEDALERDLEAEREVLEDEEDGIDLGPAYSKEPGYARACVDLSGNYIVHHYGTGDPSEDPTIVLCLRGKDDYAYYSRMAARAMVKSLFHSNNPKYKQLSNTLTQMVIAEEERSNES